MKFRIFLLELLISILGSILGSLIWQALTQQSRLQRGSQSSVLLHTQKSLSAATRQAFLCTLKFRIFGYILTPQQQFVQQLVRYFMPLFTFHRQYITTNINCLVLVITGSLPAAPPPSKNADYCPNYNQTRQVPAHPSRPADLRYNPRREYQSTA